MQPLVSVIIPFYNRGSVLKRAIESAVHQTYQNIEIVFVDDGSVEDLFPLIQECMAQHDIQYKFFRQQNAGPGAARALGLLNAQGEYFVYLDSDDELLPEMVEKLLEKLISHPDAVMCYSQHRFIKLDSGEIVLDHSLWQGMDLLELALNCRPWPTSACMWHYPDKQVVKWPNIYRAEDIVHDVSIGVINANLLFVPEVLLNVYDSDDRLTSAQVLMHNRERRANDILFVRVACYELLFASSLGRIKKYNLQFVERCFRGGIQLAMMGDVRRSIQCLQIAIRLSIIPLQFLEVLGAMVLVLGSFGKLPNVYWFYFKLHMKLTSPKIHCYKTPWVQ